MLLRLVPNPLSKIMYACARTYEEVISYYTKYPYIYGLCVITPKDSGNNSDDGYGFYCFLLVQGKKGPGLEVVVANVIAPRASILDAVICGACLVSHAARLPSPVSRSLQATATGL